MAKNDNLKDFLTDVANAIREKKGTTDLINPQDFSAEIASIQGGSGGGGEAVAAGAINFRDYDGSILHSYTKDEFLALTEFPPLPTSEGLICQGWNWDFADAVEYVTDYGVLEAYATYITNDGQTRLYITIAAEGRMAVPLRFSQTLSDSVIIDWGDGSERQTLSGTGTKGITHHYNAIGDYVIRLEVGEGCTLGLGYRSSSYCIMGKPSGSGLIYCNMLKKVEIGKNVPIVDLYAFYHCYSLASIVIPQGVTKIESAAFQNCYSLASVAFPKGLASLGSSAFQNCYSLASVVIPKGVTSIGEKAFYYCYSLALVVISKGVASIGNSAFYYCYSLSSVVIPKSVTALGNTTFYNCYSLASIVIPEGVTTIGTQLCSGCHSLASAVIPQGVTSFGSSVFSGCYSLASIAIPQGVTSFSNQVFHNCYSLTSIVLPQGLTKINSGLFNTCQSLASVVIPSGVTSIEAKAFYTCQGMAYYDFSLLESVPTLANTNAFYSIPSDCKIIVPDALYDEWIAATNWSTYASYIVKKSEWDALNA